jgi:predicted nucleic-acid-binding protein
MIGLDTNVLVRYLAQDDPFQSRIAEEFIEDSCSEQDPAFINLIVLCETVWVLRCCYDVDRETIAGILEKVIKTEQFQIPNIDLVWRAIKEFKNSGADFADCLIAQMNLANGCEQTVTFDRKASKCTGYQLLGEFQA